MRVKAKSEMSCVLKRAAIVKVRTRPKVDPFTTHLNFSKLEFLFFAGNHNKLKDECNGVNVF